MVQCGEGSCLPSSAESLGRRSEGEEVGRTGAAGRGRPRTSRIHGHKRPNVNQPHQRDRGSEQAGAVPSLLTEESGCDAAPDRSHHRKDREVEADRDPAGNANHLPQVCVDRAVEEDLAADQRAQHEAGEPHPPGPARCTQAQQRIGRDSGRGQHGEHHKPVNGSAWLAAAGPAHCERLTTSRRAHAAVQVLTRSQNAPRGLR